MLRSTMEGDNPEFSVVVATDKEKTFAYIEPNLKRKAERLAKSRARSLSSLIEWLLIQEVRAAEQTGELIPTDTQSSQQEDS